jgi:hypothetical protein
MSAVVVNGAIVESLRTSGVLRAPRRSIYYISDKARSSSAQGLRAQRSSTATGGHSHMAAWRSALGGGAQLVGRWRWRWRWPDHAHGHRPPTTDHSPPTAERMYENGCTIFRGCTRMYEFFGGLRGVGPAIFLAFACRGGAASTEIASCELLGRGGLAGCPAIGAGRPDKWACRARRPQTRRAWCYA